MHSATLAIAVTGFACSIGQIILLRELLVLFYGNELSTGILFAGWLVWTAAGSGLGAYWTRRSRWPRMLTCALALLGALFPLSVLWIRASRLIWSIPLGEVVPPARMLAISLSATSLFCLSSGFLFALAWSIGARGEEGRAGQPLRIYLAEAAGAALGGLCFYFVLLPGASALKSSLVVGGLVVLMAWGIDRGMSGEPCKEAYRTGRSRASAWLWLLAAVPLSCGLIFSERLDGLSRSWLWGPDVLTARETPYHNLALLKREDQFSLFANGLWLFSVPDPQSAEYAVHLALLQHPEPRHVLLIGGAASGLLKEALKYPSIEEVDCVEPDPEIIRMAREFLLPLGVAVLDDARVRLLHLDATSYVRRPERRYDAVLLNLGEPVNVEMNRYYTVEFFTKVKKLLSPGGVFSFGVSSSPDIIGPAQARVLRSLDVTLKEVFGRVLVIPGESARFMASDRPESLVSDPLELVERIGQRGLELFYVREYYLFDYMHPARLEYLASLLAESGPVRLNRDFEPTCYFNGLILWAAQLDPLLEKGLNALSGVRASWLWAAIGATGLAIVGFFARGRSRLRAAVLLGVAVAGGAQMVVEIVLLLGFQILEGFVYTELALIVAAFMAGIASGAAVLARLQTRLSRPRLWLVLVQGAFGLFLPGILGLLFLMRYLLEVGGPAGSIIPWLFPALALVAGLIGGLHFSLAATVLSENLPSSAGVGGRLYAVDLAGAAMGALGTSLFVLPVFGLPTTLMAAGALLLASMFALMRA